MSQQIILSSDSRNHKVCFRNFWDSHETTFRECFLPVVVNVPTLFAVIIVFSRLAVFLLPKRPRWTRHFVQEYPESEGESAPTRQTWSWGNGLLTVLAGAGFLAQLALVFFGSINYSNATVEVLSPALTWVAILSVAVIYRPQTAPPDVLLLSILFVVSEAILLSHRDRGMIAGLVGTSLGLAILIVLVILWMPLRDPSLGVKGIAKEKATSNLRSPEDRLRTWQFLTVSWMKPLIDIGSTRQLQDEDVWQLPFEFQHKRLHDNFRLLNGTVIQRLIEANAIDLCISIVIGLLELTCSLSTPIFLQQILASMEDQTVPKRSTIVYASMSLAVSLVNCQLGVFGLWFGRRAYERSRGEMITMLYEKTLQRKISFQQQGKETERPIRSRWAVFASLCQQSKDKSRKEPASMGKILNLMRNDVYEVAQRFWDVEQLVTCPLSIISSAILVLQFLGPSAWLAMLVIFLSQVFNFALARVDVYFEVKRRGATDKKLQLTSQFVESIRHLRWYGWQRAWLEQVMEARRQELRIKLLTHIWFTVVNFFNALAMDFTPVVAFYAYTVVAKQPLTVHIAFPALQLFNIFSGALGSLPGLITILVNAWVAVGRIEDFMAEPDKEKAATEALVGDSMSIDHGTFNWPGIDRPVLKDIDLTFPPGLTVVYGELASGKTALLQSLLGELDMTSGQLVMPSEPVAYCAQSPWLQSMSIRDNILFFAPLDERRYSRVLDACMLNPDLAEFKDGDLSMIGENGVGLSGGQKARVALARALYSQARILLLDDPLSALDQQTAESVAQKSFAGPLMEGRTVVLVTHRTDLVEGMAIQHVKMREGTAFPQDQVAVSTELSSQPDAVSVMDQPKDAVLDKFIEDEYRAHGSVDYHIYWEYVKAGKLRWWAFLILTLVFTRLASIGATWFLKTWGEAYNERPIGFFENLPAPDINPRPWLIWFLLFSFAESIAFVVNQGATLVIVYTAARRLFKQIMERVAHATFRFYDKTPVGRLMNRMTSDISVIDGGISLQLQGVVSMGITWLASVLVIASVTPVFLAFQVFLASTFVLVFRKFLPTSQSLRRLEMVSLTPLMSNFGSLLNGLSTVRAFHAQGQFQDAVVQVVDTFQKMDHFYWSLQTWLSYRFDALSAMSGYLLTLLALATNLSAGLTAFVLIAARQFVSTTHALCRQYGQLQMQFVSVERVVELLHLEQEPPGDVMPPAWWPSVSGEVVFDNVTIKYAPHAKPALKSVSFRVKGGSKVAVIGRTGSGKSTLALSLLATILPESGHIFIDGIDLARVDKQTLRTRVTFLAQDPVLFPGSMRENLDPVQEHTDEDCLQVLHRVCGRQGWELDTHVEAGGRNFSQGQRQLVGLARAVLRKSSIIVLDEATASIDRETAAQIQQVMHEDLASSTVITIAHRVEAAQHADYRIVLANGKVIDEGPTRNK
ncbi:putative ABC transporter [Piedraia hortae CBS 480.64]|uniref:Putative ABC transporter n=1 Tax=Piedraia hortae CBS 480.64 TaxID=1314780 RepID=A0A6A7BV17_9PEZI|nr:putative ABC transporter [Piedraia hortae CBS 480.64]